MPLPRLGPAVRWTRLEDDLAQVVPATIVVSIRNAAVRRRVTAGLLARGLKVVIASLPGPATAAAYTATIAIVDHATLLSVRERDPKALRQSVVLVLGDPRAEDDGGPWVRRLDAENATARSPLAGEIRAA